MRKLVCMFVLGLSALAPLAQAGAPTVAGSWNISFSLEPNRSAGATQCIVFTASAGTVAGVSTSGTWTSPSFPGWSGQWIQLGDHVRWFGITGSLATAESGNMVNHNAFEGVSFNHFSTANAMTSSAGSWTGTRVSSCRQSEEEAGAGDPSH